MNTTFTLRSNVENLTHTGTPVISGTGNALDNALTGNAAANLLTGAAGNDTLDGAAGADTLAGGTGADTYRFGIGYGIDTVQENDATAGVKDAVQFTGTIKQANVAFKHVGLRRCINCRQPMKDENMNRVPLGAATLQRQPEPGDGAGQQPARGG